MTRRWPFPGDTQAQRARWIARWILAALAEINPNRAVQMRELAAGFGETWLDDELPAHERDERVTTTEGAAIVQRPEVTIRSWISRGKLRRALDGKILVADLLTVDAQMRRRNADS